MGSTSRTRVIIACLLVLLLGSSSAQTPSFCTVLNAFVTNPSAPAGFLGSDLTDVSFIAQNCKAGANSMTFDASAASSATATFLPAGLTMTDATVRRSITASMSAAQEVNIDASIVLNAKVVGSYNGATISTAVVVTVAMKVAGLPAAAAGSLPVAWTGVLSTAASPATNVVFQDGDIFDDGLPAIFTVGGTVSDELVKTSEYVTTLAGDFNINLGGLTISHPSLVFRSVRGGFIGGVNTIPASAVRAGQFAGLTEAGVLVQQIKTCDGASCSADMASVMSDVVKSAALGLCDAPEQVMLRSSRVLDLFASSSTVNFRSASGTTEALFKCGTYGYVGLQLRAQNGWPNWPTAAFLEDNTTASYMTKSSSPYLGGWLWGDLSVGNKSYSFVRSDIFGVHGGGRLILNRPFVPAAVSAFITQLHDNMNTGIDLVDAAMDSTDADWAGVRDRYLASTLHPTWNGFLQYYADAYPGFSEVTFGAATSCPGSALPCVAVNPVFDLAFTTQALTIPKTNPFVAGFDSVLTNFNSKLAAKYSVSGVIPAVAASSSATITLFVAFVHRVRINGDPTPTGTYVNTTSIITQEGNPQLFIAASLMASFATGTNSLLSSVEVHLVNSTTGSNTTVVRGAVASMFQPQLGPSVSLDSTGAVVGNLGAAALASFQDRLNNASAMLGNMEFFYTIAPLSITPRQTGDTTYMDMLTAIYHALPSYTTNSQAAAAALESLVKGMIGTPEAAIFIPRISVLSATTMEIDMRFTQLQMVTVDSIQLTGRIDMSELKIPTIVQTHLLMKIVVGTGNTPSVVFELKAAANYSDFTLPISLSMNAAVCKTSAIGVILSLPGGASFMDLAVSTITDLGAEVQLQFKSETLDEPSSVPIFRIYGEEQVQTDPIRVYGDVKNLFLLPDANLDGALNIPFYPWGDSFSSHMSYAAVIKKQVPWLIGPTFTSTSPAVTGALCLADIPTSVVGNFTVNARPMVTCDITVDTTSYDMAQFTLNIGLAICGLSNYLMAVNIPDGGDGCVRIALNPKSPGVVYALAAESNLWRGNWGPTPFTEFTSWPELPVLLRAVIPQATVTDVKIFTAPSSAFPSLVDTSLRSVFPKMTVVEYSVGITYSVDATGVNASTTATTEDEFSMDLADGVGSGTISMAFGGSVRSVMDLPIAAVCVSTNFTGDADNTQTTVPASANQLSLGVTAMVRTASGTSLRTWEGALTLTPNMALSSALAAAVATQPAGSWLAGLLNSSVSVGDPELGISNQVLVCLNGQFLPSGEYVMPLDITVTDMNSPFFGTQTLAPPNYINTALVNLTVDATLEATATAENTSIGVVQFVTPNQVTGTGTVHVEVKSTTEDGAVYQGIGKLSGAAQRTKGYLSTWSLAVGTIAHWSVTDVTLVVDNNGIGASNIDLDVNSVKAVVTGEELQALNDLQLEPTYSVSTLARLAHMDKSPFCNGISTILRLAEAVVEQPITSKQWPFMDFSASGVFGSTVKSLANRLADRVCMTKGLTLASFCDLLQATAGFPMCKTSTADSSALILLLQYTDNSVTDHAPFVFDFSGFGANALDSANGTIVTGLDANFDVLTTPSGTIELLMEVTQPTPTFILGEHTAFKMESTADFFGELQAKLGPARVTFTGTSGNLDLTMDVALTGAFSKREERPGTAHFSVTREPSRSRRLAVRQGEGGLPVEISLTGSSSFKSAMMRELKVYCMVDVTIASLAEYFTIGGRAGIDNTQCVGGTDAAISDVVETTNPLGAWGDVGMLMSVILGKIRDFLKKILGPKLAGMIFPLLEKLAVYLMEPLQSVIAPTRVNKMSNGWTNTISGLQQSDYTDGAKPGKGEGMGGMWKTMAPGRKRDLPMGMGKWKTMNGWKYPGKTMGMGMGMAGTGSGSGSGMSGSIWDMIPTKSEIWEFLKELIPRLFTKLLCTVFEDMLEACPPAPPAGADPKNWTLPFSFGKTVPILTSSVVLGDHGFASLEWNCTIQLVLSAKFSIMISYGSADGFGLSFPADPVLTTSARFETVPGCSVQGKLLIVGFSFLPVGSLSAELTVSKNLSVGVTVAASLSGAADVGFAGPIAKAITGDPNAITALPHLHTGITWAWSYKLGDRDAATPTFDWTEPQLCLGTYIAGIVGGLGMQVKKIIDPLAPIIGPDGILLKKIAVAKFIIGRETNLLEILGWVAKYWCSQDECTMEGVVEAIKVAAEVYKMVEVLANLGTSDPNGCGIIQMIANFNLNFTDVEPFPGFVPPFPPADVVFSKVDLLPARPAFTSYFEKSQNGEFAFQLDIIKDPVQKLIKIMMGGRVPVASFKLPEFTISVGAEWSFGPIWPMPPIYIIIGLSAGISVDIGSIALLSDGLINAITNGNIGGLVTGLGMPTKMPNGKPHYPLKAFVQISAGAEINIFIFRGGVQLYLRIEGAMGFSSINDDEWITFAEIWNLLKFNGFNPIAAMDKELKMIAGLRLYIQACVPIPFKKICFNIVNWKFEWVIFDEIWKGKKPPPIADAAGVVHLDTVEGGGKKRDVNDMPWVEIMPNSATGGRSNQYREDPTSSFAPIERNTPRNPVTFAGRAKDPFVLYVHALTDPITAPSGQPYILRMDTNSFVGISTHTITPTTLTPAISIKDCSELHYDELVPLATVQYFDGAPCASVITSVDSADILIKGNPLGYSAKPITILDSVYTVDWNVPTTTVKVSSKTIFGAPDVNVNMPPPVPFLTITGHPTDDTTYTLQDSAAGSLLKMLGGTGSDTFITRLSDNLGTVTIDGAGQGTYANWMQITVDAIAGNNVTVTPYVSAQENNVTNAKYTIHHSNTPRRSYELNAVAGEPAYFTVSLLETSALVDVHTRGAPGAIILHQLLSCNDQSELRVYVNGPGQHLVILGDGSNTLANFGMCTIRVFATSEAGQDTRIILNQGQDANRLRHVINTNSYAVRDPTGAYLFSVTFSGVDWLILNAGMQSEVTHQAGTPGTEVVIHFPDGLTADQQENSAIIENWTNAVLVNGTFTNITVGLPADPDYSVDPFQGAGAVLAINAQLDETQVFLVSGQDQPMFTAPAQRYQMNARCFDPLDLTLTKAPKLNAVPSADMLTEMLVYNNFDPTVDYSTCHVAYLGPVHFVVRTGAAPDWFNATNPDAPVDFSFYGGDDIAIWSDATTGSTLNVDLGEGRDKLQLGLPVGGDITATLGDEMQVDSVDLFPGVLSNPNVATNPDTFTAQIGPIGNAGELLTLADYHAPYDLAHIRQGPTGQVITYANTATRAPGGIVFVNAASPGEVLKVDLQSGQSYVVESCGQDTTIVLDPGSTDPDVPPAANFEITIQLPSYSQSCYILVPAVAASESLINVVYAANPGPNTPNYPATVTEMSAFPGTVWTSFGGTRIQATYIDHMSLTYPVKVNLTIDGTAGGDIAVTAPRGSWVLSGANRFASSNTLIVGPSIIVTGASLATGNLLASKGAETVQIAAPPGITNTIYNAGAVSFNPPLTPTATFSQWFIAQLGQAGLTAALSSTSINVFIAESSNVIINAPLVTAQQVGESLTAGGLFQVLQGQLALAESAALATTAINEIEMAVSTTASLSYRLRVDGGYTGTVSSTFVTSSTMSVACAGSQLPPNWVFPGTGPSSFNFVTSACSGTLLNQSPLPAVTMQQPSSTVALTSTLPVDSIPFALDVSVTGDDSTYTVNFDVNGPASNRVHAIGLTASNSTLAMNYNVNGASLDFPSIATISAVTNSIGVSFGVVSGGALNVSAIGSVNVKSVSVNVTGELSPFDLLLSAVSGRQGAFSYIVSSLGSAGVVNVSAAGSLNSAAMDLGVNGVQSPPEIIISGDIDSSNLGLNVTGDVSAVNINAVSSSTFPGTVNVFYNIFGDQNANDLTASWTATYTEQALTIALQGDSHANLTAVRLLGSIDVSALNVSVVGDISPLDVSVNATGDASALNVYYNLIDDSSEPLVLGMTGTLSFIDSLVGVKGDNHNNATTSQIIMTGILGMRGLAVNVVGDITPLNVDLALSDGTNNAGLSSYFGIVEPATGSVSPVVNMTVGATTNSIDLTLTLHGASTGQSEVGYIGAVSVADIQMSVIGNMHQLSNEMRISSDNASANIYVSVNQDAVRDLNITTSIVKFSPMNVSLQLIGDDFGQKIAFDGSLGQREVSILVDGIATVDAALVSIDNRLMLSANGASSRRPADIDVVATILPVDLRFALSSDDTMSLGLLSSVNHTAEINIVVPDPITPGLLWNLDTDSSFLQLELDLSKASTRTPVVSVTGSVTPNESHLKILGDISSLNNNLHIEDADALFTLAVGVIGLDNKRDVNISLSSHDPTNVALDVVLAGSDAAATQAITVNGVMGERNLDVNIDGPTPLLLSIVSRDEHLAIVSNATHQSRLRQGGASDPLTVSVLAKMVPSHLQLTLENGDDLSIDLVGTASHTLNAAVVVPDPVTPGLSYNLVGTNTEAHLSLAVLRAFTRNPSVNIAGVITPVDSDLFVFGDISTLNSTLFAATSAGQFGLYVGVIGADNQRDLNITVDSSAATSMELDATVIGQNSQSITVQGTMGQRTLNVAVTGATPMLVDVLSRDSTLTVNADGNNVLVNRDTVVGVAATILPLDLTLAIAGDSLNMGMIGTADSTSTVNVTFVSSDPTRALASVLTGDNSALDINLAVTGASSGDPIVALTGGYTTRSSSLNVTGGGVSQLTVDLDVLGSTEVPASEFDLYVAPLAAKTRLFNVQPQPVTADTDQHRFLTLDLALITKKTFALQLADANNTLFMNTSTIVPDVFVGGTAVLLLNNTDEHSSILFPGRRLVPDWPRDAFRPMLYNGTDCLQPLPDCTREGWIRTAVEDVLSCPNRTCTRTGVILTTPFDLQCPAYGVFPKDNYVLLVNPSDAPIKSPYSKWTFYLALVILVFAWLVPLAIWTVFGYLWWHIWAEFVICGCMLVANAHTQSLALSLIHNFNYGISTAFLFNCFDLRNLSIISWTGIAACATIIALWVLESLGNPEYKRLLQAAVIAQRFLGGWLFFFFAPIALANIWTAGVGIGTRLFFVLALTAMHLLHRSIRRLKSKEDNHVSIWVTVPAAAIVPLVLVGWTFGYRHADVTFAIGVVSVIIVNLPYFIKAWFWRDSPDAKPQWPWQPAAFIAAVVFGLIFVALVYARGPSAVIISFLLLWAVTACAASGAGRLLAYLYSKGRRIPTARHPRENMRAPLLSDAHDPSL